jgi:Protein of unknown function (DUF2971)
MRVYKFLTEKFALKVLSEHKIKISEFSDMNDPFELMGLKLSTTDEEIFPAAYIEQVLRSHFDSSYGALCFSKKWSNPLLWSHYSDKHKGICLGFEVADGEWIQQPVYVDVQQEAPASVIVDALLTGNEQAPQETITRMLLTKCKAWDYEDEVRMILRKDEKDGDFYFYPMDEKIKLCEVIPGVRCTTQRAEIEEALVGHAGLIKVIKARLSFGTFEVLEDTDGSNG